MMKLSKAEKAWCVAGPANLIVTLIHWTRRDAIKEACDAWDTDWKHMKELGYRCVKVTVTEGEDTPT